MWIVLPTQAGLRTRRVFLFTPPVPEAFRYWFADARPARDSRAGVSKALVKTK